MQRNEEKPDLLHTLKLKIQGSIYGPRDLSACNVWTQLLLFWNYIYLSWKNSLAQPVIGNSFWKAVITFLGSPQGDSDCSWQNTLYRTSGFRNMESQGQKEKHCPWALFIPGLAQGWGLMVQNWTMAEEQNRTGVSLACWSHQVGPSQTPEDDFSS